MVDPIGRPDLNRGKPIKEAALHTCHPEHFNFFFISFGLNPFLRSRQIGTRNFEFSFMAIFVLHASDFFLDGHYLNDSEALLLPDHPGSRHTIGFPIRFVGPARQHDQPSWRIRI